MRGLPVVTKQEPGQPTERYIYGFQQYPSSDRVLDSSWLVARA